MLFQETNSQSGAKWFNFNICYSVSAHKGYFKTMASMTMGNLWQASVKVKHYILLFYMQLGFPGDSDGKESACNTVDGVLSLGREGPLEKGMAMHSSVLAWRIPWTKEPGGLQSMKLQRGGHN